MCQVSEESWMSILSWEFTHELRPLFGSPTLQTGSLGAHGSRHRGLEYYLDKGELQLSWISGMLDVGWSEEHMRSIGIGGFLFNSLTKQLQKFR